MTAFNDVDFSLLTRPIPGEPCFNMIDDNDCLDKATAALTKSKDHAQFAQLLHELTYNHWQRGQLPAIASICAGQDVVCCMPPGSGKSAIYQIAGLYKRMISNSVTVVITPLISLMKDQYKKLIKHNIYAIPFYSGQKWELRQQAEMHITDSQFLPTFIFLTPERLCQTSYSWLDQLYDSGRLGLFVLDEAQVVFEWGCGYRPAYLKLKELRSRYPSVPQLSLSGSLSSETLQRYIGEMNLKDCLVVSGSPDRPNLFYSVHDIQDLNINEEVIKFIKSEISADSSTIVYCRTPKACKSLQEKLRKKGIKAVIYHGELAAEQRDISYELWYSGRIRIMIATIAFGMGIDKKDVRFILHMNLPKDLSAYIQETGRAGRDGELAICVLFYRFSDGHDNHSMALREKRDSMQGCEISSYPTPSSSQTSMTGSVYDVIQHSPVTLKDKISASYNLLRMCASPRLCRRVHILRFYSPDSEVPRRCAACDVCVPARFGRSTSAVHKKYSNASSSSTGDREICKTRAGINDKKRIRGGGGQTMASTEDPANKRRKLSDAKEIIDVDALSDESCFGDDNEDSDLETFSHDSDSENDMEYLPKSPRNRRLIYQPSRVDGLPYLGASNRPCARVTYEMAEEVFCAIEFCVKRHEHIGIGDLAMSVEKRVTERRLINLLGLQTCDESAADGTVDSGRASGGLTRRARIRIWLRTVHGMILQHLLELCHRPEYGTNGFIIFYVKTGNKALECFEAFDILL